MTISPSSKTLKKKVSLLPSFTCPATHLKRIHGSQSSRNSLLNEHLIRCTLACLSLYMYTVSVLQQSKFNIFSLDIFCRAIASATCSRLYISASTRCGENEMCCKHFLLHCVLDKLLAVHNACVCFLFELNDFLNYLSPSPRPKSRLSRLASALMQ